MALACVNDISLLGMLHSCFTACWDHPVFFQQALTITDTTTNQPTNMSSLTNTNEKPQQTTAKNLSCVRWRVSNYFWQPDNHHWQPFTHWPLPPASADNVICFHSFYHTNNKKRVLRKKSLFDLISHSSQKHRTIEPLLWPSKALVRKSESRSTAYNCGPHPRSLNQPPRS